MATAAKLDHKEAGGRWLVLPIRSRRTLETRRRLLPPSPRPRKAASRSAQRKADRCLCLSPRWLRSTRAQWPPTATSTLSSLTKPELHRNLRQTTTVSGVACPPAKEGEWETPLGRMRVDDKAARNLADATGIVDFDPDGPQDGTLAEVQLPFLQKIYGRQGPAPPRLSLFQDLDTTKALAEGVAKVVQRQEGAPRGLVGSHPLRAGRRGARRRTWRSSIGY